MSDINNSNLIERGYELVEVLTSHPARIDQRIAMAIEAGDMEDLAKLVADGETIMADMAREEIHGANII